jgi:hypothetical protein
MGGFDLLGVEYNCSEVLFIFFHGKTADAKISMECIVLIIHQTFY